MNVLATLPFAVTWIDSRDEIFPPQLPANRALEHSDPVQAAVRRPGAGLARADHELQPRARTWTSWPPACGACASAHDLPYIGLIGSKTKWATFRHRLEERGFTAAELAQVTCPIGVPGITGKEPEVIAVAWRRSCCRASARREARRNVYTLRSTSRSGARPVQSWFAAHICLQRPQW